MGYLEVDTFTRKHSLGGTLPERQGKRARHIDGREEECAKRITVQGIAPWTLRHHFRPFPVPLTPPANNSMAIVPYVPRSVAVQGNPDDGALADEAKSTRRNFPEDLMVIDG